MFILTKEHTAELLRTTFGAIEDKMLVEITVARLEEKIQSKQRIKE